jgi:hypothetical protein
MKLEEFVGMVDTTDVSEIGGSPVVENPKSGKTYTIDMDALKFAEKEWKLAIPIYNIGSRADRAVCLVSLIAAGIANADEAGETVVHQANIEAGWNQLKLCPGNAPPHLCLGKSIVDRRDTLIERDDILGSALRLL